MSQSDSTTSTSPGKPSKPFADFPLFPHAAGVWAKKIRGKLHYFGPWSDPDAALAKYLNEKDALHAGRKPREDASAATVKEVVNRFLGAKQDAVGVGELSPRTWACYKEACDAVVAAFGKARLVADLDPEDFGRLRNRLAKRYGPHGLGTRIQCVRCAFKHAFDSGLIDRPVRYGPDFKKPSKKTLRLHRAKQGAKLFSREEIRGLLGAAGTQMKSMILLAVNAGFGNADCGTLPLTALDLDGSVIDFPRPKTGIARRAVLWPETIEALREVLAERKEPKDEGAAGLVFVTKRGAAWHRDKGVLGGRPVSHEFTKLLKKLGIGGRKGLGFYTLRHTFCTVADEAKDQPAADHIMGHEVAHMSSVYRECISDARLRAVTDHVRAWLFAPPGAKVQNARLAVIIEEGGGNAIATRPESLAGGPRLLPLQGADLGIGSTTWMLPSRLARSSDGPRLFPLTRPGGFATCCCGRATCPLSRNAFGWQKACARH